MHNTHTVYNCPYHYVVFSLFPSIPTSNNACEKNIISNGVVVLHFVIFEYKISIQYSRLVGEV
jgi:hypothetical protein